jgi:hypothetical protein
MLAIVQHWPRAQRGAVRRILLPLFALIALALVIGPSRLAPEFGPTGGPIVVTATPVTLDPRDPQNWRAGELTFLRGWHLTASPPALGGLSGLRAWHGLWLAVMDTGALAELDLHSGRGRIIPVNPRCAPNRLHLGHDLEGIDTDGIRIWVSSEWHNSICRIDPDGVQSGVQPKDMADWPRNTGAETLLRLHDGRFLILPEAADRAALLFPRDPVSGVRPQKLRYTPPTGYSPTDAAELPDGRIVILNRKLGLHGFANTLVLFDGIPAHGVAQGRTIATLAAPLIHDNFEGIAARREGDATILTIVSDDNFNRWQRTLLLEFRLDR